MANDVLCGFFPAPIPVWGGLRAAFVAEGGSLHGVGERLRPPACVSYLPQDDSGQAVAMDTEEDTKAGLTLPVPRVGVRTGPARRGRTALPGRTAAPAPLW